jgi:nicotinate phosphoribosyltransferase
MKVEKMKPIITDYDSAQDFYKENMTQVIFSQFPAIQGEYVYTNRDPNKTFRPGFAVELNEQIAYMAELQRKPKVETYLQSRAPWLKPTFLEWQRTNRFNPSDVSAYQDNSNRLHLQIGGEDRPSFIRHLSKWEVPLLSLISELDGSPNGVLNPMDQDWENRVYNKGKILSENGIHFMEFGTRRRASYSVQRRVNEILKQFQPFYLGTSNIFIAADLDVNIQGTIAHEQYMIMQAVYGLALSNIECSKHWVREFQGSLGIALPDTLTTNVFLRNFNTFYANLYKGVRQDSGDPYEFGEKIIAHYNKLNIDPTTKYICFSDGLNVDTCLRINEYFSKRIRVIMGIGTNLTNDVGWKPLNQVIKLSRVYFDGKWKKVYKLGDGIGKSNANADEQKFINQILDI